MRQAIETKWLGPTNFWGPRIKAFADAGSVTIELEPEWTPTRAHTEAARALAVRCNWGGSWVSGALKNGNRVFVTADPCDSPGEGQFTVEHKSS